MFYFADTNFEKSYRTYFRTCSFLTKGDTKGGEDLSSKQRIIYNLACALIRYTPIVNNIYFTVKLIRERNEKIENLDQEIERFHDLICATGFGIYLLPLHIAATIGKMIYNKKHEEDPISAEIQIVSK